MIKRNNYDLLVRMFVATSTVKEELTRPFLQKGHVYATNAFFAVQIEKDLLGYEYQESEVDPKASVLFEGLKVSTEKEYIVNDLLGIMAAYDVKTEMVGLERKCKECDGSGESECGECGHETECEYCSGTGGKNDVKGRISICFTAKEGRYNEMKFGESKLNAQYLGTAILAMKLAGAETCYIEEKTDRLLVSDNNGVNILIMLMVTNK